VLEELLRLVLALALALEVVEWLLLLALWPVAMQEQFLQLVRRLYGLQRELQMVQ
jgi:hypothetical protein